MTRRLVGPALGVVLLLAACGEGGGGAAAGEGGTTLEIVAPEDGAEIGQPFTIELESSEELGPPEEGVHHVHVYFDGDDSEYEIVEAETWDVTTIQAPAGEHTLHASLRNADHSAAGVETEVTVTVRQGGTDGGDDDGGIGY
jgi:ABC-type glycerol-3-phosphate transport system substrate-binding protein